MKIDDFSNFILIHNRFSIIKTWTAQKYLLLNELIHILTSGKHEYFCSNYKIHGKYVGSFYIEENDHKRNGTLKKYRGKKLIVFCYKRGIGQNRHYIVSLFDDSKS
jgi:hypothetical protein